MGNPKRDQLSVNQRRAILVSVVDPAHAGDRERILEELSGLVRTAQVQVVDSIVQYRARPHPRYCVGRGKLDELIERIHRHDAELVVFDNNLSPAQGKALEDATKTVIVDRSEVILDIFATHARTSESMLQVELAQLLYFRTRLKRMWTHLERIEGGIGTGRGPGEKQLETDRRLIDRRVAALKRKLREVEKRRERTVFRRRSTSTVSLVGYTNAGKSTLMNALTDAGTVVADQLFATLDTRTRRWLLPEFGDVLLSDTVGFVRDLPHHLVASFRSTLEEARHADLLLHVVDAAHPDATKQIEVVYRVLEQIGVKCTNVLLVLNKLDAVRSRSHVDILRARYADSVSISAASRSGLDRLELAVRERLTAVFVDAEIQTDVGNGRLFAFLAKHGQVTSREYNNSHVRLRCRLPQRVVRSLPDSHRMTVTIPPSERVESAD